MTEKWEDFTKKAIEVNKLLNDYASMYSHFKMLLNPDLPSRGTVSAVGMVRISLEETNLTTDLGLRVSMETESKIIALKGFVGSGANFKTVYEKELPSPESCTEQDIRLINDDEILLNIYQLLANSPLSLASFTDA